MGLDMYAQRVVGGAALACLANDVSPDFGAMPEDTTLEGNFWYWRKHADLQGWMERRYRAKGGAAEVFNCVAFRLRAEDLDQLEADMEAGLERTTGFFFGQSTAEDTEDTRAFIKAAREAIAAGDAIYYDSWW